MAVRAQLEVLRELGWDLNAPSPHAALWLGLARLGCCCAEPSVRRSQVCEAWTAVYGIIAKTMIGDNYAK